MAPEWRELRAGLLGGLVGGILLGVILQLMTPILPAMSKLYFVETPSLATGWIAHVFFSLIFGVLFTVIVTRYIDDYIGVVLSLTTRSDVAKNLVLPLTDRFGMALVVTTAMGLIYGLTVGVLVGVLFVPALAPVVLFPFVSGAVLLGYALFGVTMGTTYGRLVMG